MWFILSLAAMLSWAGSDFFSKRGTRPDDKSSHLKLVIIVGTAMFLHALIFMTVMHLRDGFTYDPLSLVKYAPAAAFYIAAMVFGYMGLRYIQLSVGSPICNSSGAVVSILCFVFLKQEMVPLQAGGVALICAGVLGLAILEKRYAEKPELGTDRKYRVGVLAILLPLLYLFLDSVGTFTEIILLDETNPILSLSEDQALLSFEFTFALCALAAFLYMRFVKKEKFSYRKEGNFNLAAVCETAGQFAYVYAIADTAHAGMAAPMIASYCVFSVILSRIFLKEKLKLPQYLVIAMVVIGIAILGVFDEA